MHANVKFYSSAPSNNVTVRHYLEGFILVFWVKSNSTLGHNSSKYGKLMLSLPKDVTSWQVATQR